MDTEQEQKLRTLAADIRIKAIRCMASAGGGHIGGSMSIADVLAVLYGAVMKYDPLNPRWEERDRLVLSKGHCGPALYAVLAIHGFFPEKELLTLNKGGTMLPSHADRIRTPGIDMSTGSLGQGVSAASGMAYALKIKKSAARVYAILGDGELQEGQVWECMQFAAHNKLDNFTIIVDNNHKQLDGSLEEICNPFDLVKKFEAFGLSAFTAIGYAVEDVYEKIQTANQSDTAAVVILDTAKGIGCNFAETADFCHFMNYGFEEAEAAEEEIRARLDCGIVKRRA